VEALAVSRDSDIHEASRRLLSVRESERERERER
jgi:hypothetical protein